MKQSRPFVYALARYDCGTLLYEIRLTRYTQNIIVKRIFFFSGNGYIEGTELDGFLREFVSSANTADVSPEVLYNIP